MYILLIIMSLNGNGKAINLQQINFKNEKLCTAAKEQFDKESENFRYRYYDKMSLCLRVK